MLTGCSGETPKPPIDAASHLQAQPFIAHRGGGARFPEASMRAYEKSAESGFPLEIDLRVLADGTLALMHDATVDRTTNGTGEVANTSPSDWSALRIDVGPGPAAAAPLWEEVLARFGGVHPLVVEIKDRAARRSFIDTVTDMGVTTSVIAQSSDPEDARVTASAGIPSMLLSNRVTDPAALKRDGVAYLAFSAKRPRAEAYVRTAKAAGLKVAVYTVNDPTRAEKFFQMGVDAVFTDDPWLLAGSR